MYYFVLVGLIGGPNFIRLVSPNSGRNVLDIFPILDILTRSRYSRSDSEIVQNRHRPNFSCFWHQILVVFPPELLD